MGLNRDSLLVCPSGALASFCPTFSSQPQVWQATDPAEELTRCRRPGEQNLAEEAGPDRGVSCLLQDATSLSFVELGLRTAANSLHYMCFGFDRD